MLAANNLNVTIGKATILHDCSVSLERGELLGVIGPNGAGKSTLLAALAGVRKFSSGQLLLDDRALTTFAPRERAKRIAYLPQQGEVSWPISVERLVELGRLPHLELRARLSERDHDAVTRALTLTDMMGLRDRIVSTLSGGERERALLARALATESAYLVADEPVAHLDPHYQRSILTCLREAAQRGAGVVVVLHDLSLAAQFCTRLALMHRGKIVAAGLPDDVIDATIMRETFALKPQRLRLASGEVGVLWSAAD